MVILAALLLSLGLAVAVVAVRRERGSGSFGMAAGGAVVACAGLIGLISFTDWSPPDWLRVASGVAGALAWAAALGAGAGDLARGRRRNGAIALLLAAIATTAVITMAAVAE